MLMLPASWEEESLPKLEDLSLVFFLGLMYPILHIILDRSVFEVMGRRLIYPRRGLSKGGASKSILERREKTILKFKESAWKATYYSLVWCYGLYITIDEPWFWKTIHFWDNWPDNPVKYKLKVLYALQLGFYSYGFFALLGWETRRKDFGPMLAHHISTIILLGYSYLSGFIRVGNMVLVSHDVTDILLESAKVFKYSGYDFGASLVFVLFALSWLLLRLIYYPFWIIYSTSYETVLAVAPKLSHSRIVTFYYAFNTFLITLLVLHIYWWYLIAKMIKRQIQQQGIVQDDVRSDSEED